MAFFGSLCILLKKTTLCLKFVTDTWWIKKDWMQNLSGTLLMFCFLIVFKQREKTLICLLCSWLLEFFGSEFSMIGTFLGLMICHHSPLPITIISEYPPWIYVFKESPHLPHEFCTDRTKNRLPKESGNKSVSSNDVTFLFSHGATPTSKATVVFMRFSFFCRIICKLEGTSLSCFKKFGLFYHWRRQNLPPSQTFEQHYCGVCDLWSAMCSIFPVCPPRLPMVNKHGE